MADGGQVSAVSVEPEGSFVIQDIKARVGLFLPKGQAVFNLKNKESGSIVRVRAKAPGRVTEVLKKAGDQVTKGCVVFFS